MDDNTFLIYLSGTAIVVLFTLFSLIIHTVSRNKTKKKGIGLRKYRNNVSRVKELCCCRHYFAFTVYNMVPHRYFSELTTCLTCVMMRLLSAPRCFRTNGQIEANSLRRQAPAKH